MAAVVRVKRALDQEPHEALVVSCKRRKQDDLVQDPVRTVFQFAGTVKDPDENVALLISNAAKREDAKTASKPIVNILSKVRAQAKATSESNRLRYVNCFRALDHSVEEGKENDIKEPFTVLEVESEQTAQSESTSTDDKMDVKLHVQYVYDFYYKHPDTSDVDVDDLLLDGMISVEPFGTELVHESYRNNRADGFGSDSDSPVPDDEDDSNDENNWRNDYPDEDCQACDDSEESDLEFHTREMGRVRIGDEELSSDEEDEKLYASNLTSKDVDKYGLSYASYKVRVLKEFHNSSSASSSDLEQDIDDD